MGDRQSDLFCQACEMVAPLELQVMAVGGGPACDYSFNQPFVLLGRDPGNHLCLQDERVSQKHAFLQVVAGNVFFADLGSRHGILSSNRRRLQGWLRPGTDITIAPFTIRLRSSPGDSSLWHVAPGTLPTHSLLRDQSLVPTVTLEITNQRRHSRWKVNRILTLLGSELSCNVRLTGRGVSRFHCSLLHTPGGLWITDLQSRRGTFVNGKRIDWAPFHPGDEVQVGPFQLRAAYEARTETQVERRSPAGDATRRYDLEPFRLPVPVPRKTQLIPAPSGELQANNAILKSMMDQFQLMQEDMFDQFRQTIVMIVQAFSSLHHERSKDVLTQLDEVGRLTEEVRQLQALLQQGSAVPNVPPPEGEDRDTTSESTATTPEAPPPDAETPPLGGATESPAEAPQGEDAVRERVGAGIHLWLADRIEALNAARKGRWQRILDMVFGK
jgi:pSer/pThr/pTyr-binding forkhead associated (FHA) protein